MKEQDVEKKNSKGIILKELLKHMKYVFLEKEKPKPMIIETNLTTKKEEKVKDIMRTHKEAITWLVEDLKGISLSICMHKILMDENARTSIEHQRILNPVINISNLKLMLVKFLLNFRIMDLKLSIEFIWKPLSP